MLRSMSAKSIQSLPRPVVCPRPSCGQTPSLSRLRRNISLSVLDAKYRRTVLCLRATLYLHLNRVRASIGLRWRKRQTVFMPDQIRHLPICFLECLRILRKIGPSARSTRQRFQPRIRLRKRLFGLRDLLLRPFFSIPQWPAHRNRQNHHIPGFQSPQYRLHRLRRRSVHPAGHQHNRLLAR